MSALPVTPEDDVSIPKLWGEDFARNDLAKSGLDSLSFPIKVGTSRTKHEGLEYYTVIHPGSDYTVDRRNTPDKSDRYRFLAGRPAEVYWPSLDGGATNCKRAFKTANLTAILEGQKKAAKFYLDTRVPVAGIPGSPGWSERVEAVSEHLEHRVMRGDLLEAQGPENCVLIGMDGDVLTNATVGAELATLAYECMRLGSTVICPDFGVDETGARLGYDDWSMRQFKFGVPSPEEVLKAILELPRIDLSALPLLKSYYTASLDRFNYGYDDFSDRGNATYLSRIYGDGNIKYLEDTGQWAVYDSLQGGSKSWRVWQGDSLELVNAASLQRLRHSSMLFKQLEALGPESDSDSDSKKSKRTRLVKLANEVLKSHQHLSSNSGRSAVLNDLKTRQSIRASRSLFDASPNILHVPSGIVDLRTGELRPVKREDYVLNVTRGDYTGAEPTGEKAQRFKRFMSDITSEAHGKPDPVMLEYFLRRQGASLVFGVPLAAIEILHSNDGGTGRSAWAKVDEAMLGDYACTVPAGILLASYKQQSGEGATPFLVRTKTRRKIFASETTDTQVFDEAKLKQATGGDPIAGRGNYKDADQWYMGATIMYLTNRIPRITNLDPALCDRLAIMPFKCRWNRKDKVFTSPDDADLPVADTWFIDEAYLDQEVLDWLLWAEIQAGVRYKASGLGEIPASLLKATTDYIGSQDTLGDWLAESPFELSDDPKDRVPVREVYDIYRTNTIEAGLQPVSKNIFSGRLRGRFKTVTSTQTGGVMYYYGLRRRPRAS